MKTFVFTFFCAVTFAVGADTLVLDNGAVKTLEDDLATTGITFKGGDPSSIIALRGTKTKDGSQPSSEFATIHGVAVLSPDGTAPGAIDASTVGSAGGRIATGLTDLVFDTADSCVSGALADGVTAATYLPASGTSDAEVQVGREITYWKGRKLSDIKSVRALISYTKDHNENVARTCNFMNDGQSASVLFQSRDDHECRIYTGQTYSRKCMFCAKVVFTQDGDDIKAKIAWCRCAETGTEKEIVDFESRYKADTLTHVKIYDGTVDQAGCSIRAIEAGEALDKGAKGVAVAFYDPICSTTDVIGADPVVYWKNARLSDIEMLRADMSAASKWMTAYGYFFNRVDADTLRVTFQRYAGIEERDGVTIGYDYVAATTIEFKQVNDDVTARFVAGGLTRMHSDDAERDALPANGVLPIPPTKFNVWSENYANYKVRNVRAVWKPTIDLGGPINVSGGLKLAGGGTLRVSAPASGDVPISGVGSVWYSKDPASELPINNMFYATAKSDYDGFTVFDGGSHEIRTSSAFGEGNTIVLTNNAALNLSAGCDRFMPVCAKGAFFVYPGCTLTQSTGWALNDGNSIFLFGGTFTSSQNQHFMGDLTLSDGGLVNGTAAFRFGSEPAYPHIYSTGTRTGVTNTIAATMQLYRTPKNRKQFGTIQTAADLVLSGTIRRSPEALVDDYEAALVKKRGPAKLILAPTCTNPEANANTVRVEVVEGTLRNESATALRAVNSVELHDGAVYEAVTAAQSIGALVIDAQTIAKMTTTGATVRFENGGTLSLPANGLSIAEGARLYLDGDLTDVSFRVGTSQCLPAATLSRVRIRREGKAFPVCQDSDGYFQVSGFAIIFR